MNSFFFLFDRKREGKKSRCKNLVGTKGRKRGKEENTMLPRIPLCEGKPNRSVRLAYFRTNGVGFGEFVHFLCL